MSSNPTAGRFSGQVLFATGGASGIGRAVATRFAADGGFVAIVDHDREAVQAVTDEIPGVRAFTLDVSDERAVENALNETREQFGRLDCVLNCAGHGGFGELESYSLDEWNRMIGVHATGTFLVCKHSIGMLAERGGGSIVNIASIAALTAGAHTGPYSAAKGAIIAFSRQLARDVAPLTRVNTVAPGRVRTGITVPMITEFGGGDYARGLEGYAAANLYKRIAEPEEIAAPVCFLFSDEASYMTGSLVVVDAGQSIL